MKNKKITVLAFTLLCALILCGCSAKNFFAVLKSAGRTIHESIEIISSVPDGFSQIRDESAGSTAVDDGGHLRYYGSLLTESSEISMYNGINSAVANCRESVEFLTRDLDRLLEIMGYVHYDHPEYFWFNNASELTGFEVDGKYFVTVNFEYTADKQTAADMQRRVEAAAAPVIERLKDLDDYGKVRGVYEYVITNSRYDEFTLDQSCYTLLTSGRGVCAGYASACAYLLNELGIDNIYVYGSSEGQEHAWNLVKVNGCWLQLDATWGDPVTDDGTQRISWVYFLLPDSKMLKNHTYSKELPPMPECTSEQYGYYAMEGRLLETADLDIVRDMLIDAVSRGEPLEFQCSDRMVYSRITELMFSSYRIWDVIAAVYDQYPVFDNEHISYSRDSENYIVFISPFYDKRG